MKALVHFSFLFLVSTVLAGQEVRFGKDDQRIKVFYGDQVYILADSAYVISIERALLLNEKLKELKAAQEINAQLTYIHADIMAKVHEIEQLLIVLLLKLQKDDLHIQLDMDGIIAELDRSIIVLKSANDQLGATNEELKHQLSEMHQTVKHLKKEIRHIWWSAVADKVVVGLAAFGLGFLLGR